MVMQKNVKESIPKSKWLDTIKSNMKTTRVCIDYLENRSKRKLRIRVVYPR